MKRREVEERVGNTTVTTASCLVEALRGRDGEKGDVGPRGEKGDPGPKASSVGGLYTRWGKSSCPTVTGTELVYSGRAAISSHGTDFICLPTDPEYTSSTSVGSLYVYEVEYHTHPAGLMNHNAPCAVCYTSPRATVLMIPAKLTCPQNWTTEYTGYLMTEDNIYTTHACVDQHPEFIYGTGSNSAPYEFFALKVRCNRVGIPCPPYSSANKALTCVVCSR